jgi:beta-N-acetylhexosaminidase
MQLAKLDATRERIETTELTPFRAAIAHDADAIMTAHLQVPSLDPAGLPATLSSPVLTGVLRNELGFKGLIVTDAMEMAGITSQFPEGEACARAVEAGADVLLMPLNPERCIDAIAAAVRSGRISRKRIDASAGRVLAAKQAVGLYRGRTVNLDSIPERAEDPELAEVAQRAASRAVTLVKDDKHLVPVSATSAAAGPACLVVMTEAQFSTRGEALARELGHTITDLRVMVVNAMMDPSLLAGYVSAASSCGQIYIAAFITVSANRGSVALQGGLAGFLSQLIAGPKPVALISLGNPYLLRDFPGVSTYMATFSSTPSSEIAAARALLGTAAITGKLPISVPPVAKLGDGLTFPATASH